MEQKHHSVVKHNVPTYTHMTFPQRLCQPPLKENPSSLKVYLFCTSFPR